MLASDATISAHGPARCGHGAGGGHRLVQLPPGQQLEVDRRDLLQRPSQPREVCRCARTASARTAGTYMGARRPAGTHTARAVRLARTGTPPSRSRRRCPTSDPASSRLRLRQRGHQPGAPGAQLGCGQPRQLRSCVAHHTRQCRKWQRRSTTSPPVSRLHSGDHLGQIDEDLVGQRRCRRRRAAIGPGQRHHQRTQRPALAADRLPPPASARTAPAAAARTADETGA